MDQAKNFAKGTLSTGYDDNDTSIVLITGDGAKFPSAPFNAVWWNATDYPDPADDPNVEIVRVTAKSTDTFTVTRGQEGTGGITHNTEGKTYRLIAPLTAKVINDDIEALYRIEDNGTLLQLGGATDRALAQIDNGNDSVAIGDVLVNQNGTTVLVEDGVERITLNKSVLLTGIPSSDPALEGALYYDVVTGIVKRSAG